ncbi:hypothetical protein SAMN04487967_3342 [Natronorubrum sediminis]|uniref:Uncharacterized protein n=2 Tax=Natronorubrum sediminis TaxID=640943 RepID=A0A1H6G530_9EURY|nr:hypothetical protein SAMN04487967_3342 [Natronorubrum sediminis]
MAPPAIAIASALTLARLRGNRRGDALSACDRSVCQHTALSTSAVETQLEGRPMSCAHHPDEPDSTPSSESDAAEMQWMLRKGIALALISIVALLVLIVGLDVMTGLIDLSLGTGQLALGGVLVILSLVVIGFAWPSDDREE